MEIKLIANKESLDDFKILLDANCEYTISRTFQMSSYFDAAVHLLTIGGGVAGVAKCIIEYLKLKHASRKISIITSDNEKIEIEANSTEEVEKLVNIAQSIVIEKNNGNVNI